MTRYVPVCVLVCVLWHGLADARETSDQAWTSRIPPGIPLVLIDAVSPPEVPFATLAIRQLRAKERPEIDAESRAYKAWLDTIPGARLVVTHDSGHNVFIEQPRLVIDTIREVVRGQSANLGHYAPIDLPPGI